MSQELLYTSAPKGLKPGSRGFCTVGSTQGMSPLLVERIESLSGYREVFGPHDPQAGRNPVAFSHVKLAIGGQPITLVSRTAAYGADYTDRTNKLAHHVVLDAGELPAGGPAWLATQPAFLRAAWDNQVTMWPAGRPVPRGDAPPSVCAAWRDATGDAGWAGAVIEAFLADPQRAIYLVFSLDQQPLDLLAEAISLLPHNRRWDATFSTYYTGLPQDVDCRIRCVLKDSPEAKAAARLPNAFILDLTTRPGPATGGPYVQAARTGRPASGAGAAPQPPPVPAPPVPDRGYRAPGPAYTPPSRGRVEVLEPVEEEYRVAPSDPARVAGGPPMPPPAPPRKKSRRSEGEPAPSPARTIAIVAIAVVGLGGALVAYSWFNRSSADNVATNDPLKNPKSLEGTDLPHDPGDTGNKGRLLPGNTTTNGTHPGQSADPPDNAQSRIPAATHQAESTDHPAEPKDNGKPATATSGNPNDAKPKKPKIDRTSTPPEGTPPADDKLPAKSDRRMVYFALKPRGEGAVTIPEVSTKRLADAQIAVPKPLEAAVGKLYLQPAENEWMIRFLRPDAFGPDESAEVARLKPLSDSLQFTWTRNADEEFRAPEEADKLLMESVLKVPMSREWIDVVLSPTAELGPILIEDDGRVRVVEKLQRVLPTLRRCTADTLLVKADGSDELTKGVPFERSESVQTADSWNLPFKSPAAAALLSYERKPAEGQAPFENLLKSPANMADRLAVSAARRIDIKTPKLVFSIDEGRLDVHLTIPMPDEKKFLSVAMIDQYTAGVERLVKSQDAAQGGATNPQEREDVQNVRQRLTWARTLLRQSRVEGEFYEQVDPETRVVRVRMIDPKKP